MLSWWVPRVPFAVFLAKAMQAFFFFFSDYNKYIFANHSLDTTGGQGRKQGFLKTQGIFLRWEIGSGSLVSLLTVPRTTP